MKNLRAWVWSGVATMALLGLTGCDDNSLTGSQYEQISEDAGVIRYLQFNAHTVQQWRYDLTRDCFVVVQNVVYREVELAEDLMSGVLEFPREALSLPTGSVARIAFQLDNRGGIIFSPASVGPTPRPTPTPSPSPTPSPAPTPVTVEFNPGAWHETSFAARKFRPICAAATPTPTPGPSPSPAPTPFPVQPVVPGIQVGF